MGGWLRSGAGLRGTTGWPGGVPLCGMVLLLVGLGLWVGVTPAEGAWQRPSTPDRFDVGQLPPARLGRLWPARPILPRLLNLDLHYRYATHAEAAGWSADPWVAALDGAASRALALDLSYGLLPDLGVRSRLTWRRLAPGAGDFGTGGSAGGSADLEAAVTYSPQFGRRLAIRCEVGMSFPTGSDLVYSPSPGRSLTPFTSGAREHFLAAAGRIRLSGARAVVAVDLHGAGVYRSRAPAPAGHGFVPYPEQVPLLGMATGGRGYDRLDLQFGLSLARGPAALYTICELPLLQDAADRLAAAEAPRTITQGVRVALGSWLATSVEAEFGFATDVSGTSFNPLAAYPEWHLRWGFSSCLALFDGDRDGDGIGDLADRCPRSAEDRDGFADADGCPDPDNDGDGILDRVDICPREAEDRDGFTDEDGCPDPDNDQDEIPDDLDDCPNAAEDPDGFEDEDGCPDPDNDQDGVPDAEDGCPDQAEDFDGVGDEDGCPEP